MTALTNIVVRVLTVLGLLALILIVASLATARAHSWYDPGCCSDRDCAPVKASMEADGTLRVNLGPGRSMSLPPGYPYRPSRDFDYHVCVIKGVVICAYAPGNS